MLLKQRHADQILSQINTGSSPLASYSPSAPLSYSPSQSSSTSASNFEWCSVSFSRTTQIPSLTPSATVQNTFNLEYHLPRLPCVVLVSCSHPCRCRPSDVHDIQVLHETYPVVHLFHAVFPLGEQDTAAHWASILLLEPKVQATNAEHVAAALYDVHVVRFRVSVSGYSRRVLRLLADGANRVQYHGASGSREIDSSSKFEKFGACCVGHTRVDQAVEESDHFTRGPRWNI